MEILDSWMEYGSELRKKLLIERARLFEQLRKIDSALRSMPGPNIAEPALPAINGAAEMSVPDLVYSVLRAQEHALTVQELIETLNRLRPDIDERNVHSALYRGVRNGLLVRQGKRGSSLYRMRQNAEETA